MTSRARAELFLLSTTVVWGSTFVVVKAGADLISPSLFIALRFGIGALLFALLLAGQYRSIGRRTVRRGVLLGAMLGTGIILQNYGIYLTTASKSAFITGLMVIFTPVAQLVLERRAPRPGNVVGIVVVTAGLYLLTMPEGSALNAGDLLVLISAAVFGVYIVYLDMFSRDEKVLHLSFIQVTVTSFTAAMTIPFESVRFIPAPGLIASLLYMGICATVLTTYIQTRYQKDTTPTRAVIIFTIEPVIAAVLAYFALGEVLGAVGIAGAAVIIVGILISEFGDQLIPWSGEREGI
ncbi:MAG: DMT family transporter [Bacteroidetes bacterium]|nr:MAG: DMT family transporter [Bacteroidota bacterium]